MFFDSKNEDNEIAVVDRALSLLKIKTTHDTIINYLKPHPDYPSLKSVCDFLNEIRVDHWPLRIDENELFKLNTPFIAHLNEGQGKLILIHKISDKYITYSDSASGLKRLDTDKFLKVWSRAVLLLEPSEKSGENEYPQRKKDELVKNSIIPFIFLLLVSICINGLLNNKLYTEHSPELKFFVLILTKCIGLFFSVLLFRNELDIRTKFTDKLCHLSTNTDCNAVTKSKASKIFGSISWADAGIAYFTGGLILLFIYPFTSFLSLFSILSVVSLPYPIFSILYQWLKIRKWCPMCLSVQVILIFEFILLYKHIGIDSVSILMCLNAFILFGIVFLIVLLLKMLYISLKEKEHIQLRLLKLQRDPVIFQSQFGQGEKINIPENNNSLIFGDRKNNVTITVFLSYYCSACSKKFPAIKKLLDNKIRANIQLVIPAAKDELSVRLTKIICSMQKSGNNDDIPEILNEWYNTDAKSKKELLNKYKGEVNGNFVNGMMEFHSMLFHSNKISHVPSIYINKYPLPDIYELEDIKYFIDYLGKLKLNE